MDEAAADAILLAALRGYRQRPYEALTALIGVSDIREVRAPDGRCYQLEFNVLWDHRPGGAVRVLGAIDDGGVRAFRPLTRDFVRNPDGSFAGEDA